jgi:UDP-N-acetylglucosamine:LPS N-acetylglucosamine transferase
VKAFIEDMATAYAEADGVVARAVALTLAELAIAGRPAILVPLPNAADDHQRKNAAQFANAGAAVVLEQGAARGKDLAAPIIGLAKDSAKRADVRGFPGEQPASMSPSQRALPPPMALFRDGRAGYFLIRKDIT